MQCAVVNNACNLFSITDELLSEPNILTLCLTQRNLPLEMFHSSQAQLVPGLTSLVLFMTCLELMFGRTSGSGQITLAIHHQAPVISQT